MAKATRPGNTGTTGIKAASQNETWPKKNQEVYSNDLFIDTYIKSRLAGSTPQEAGDHAYWAIGGEGSYNAPHENSKISEGLASGEYYQKDGRTYLTEDASRRYAERVKATQAQNDWANRKIGVGEAIGGGAVSGLWNSITGGMNLGAAAVGQKISSEDTNTWMGRTGTQRAAEIRRSTWDKLKDIWSDGSFGSNVKDSAFTLYDAAFKDLLEGSGRTKYPALDAIAKGSNVFFKAIRDYVLPKVTGSEDPAINAKWLTDQVYGLSDTATQAVASGGGLLQYADQNTFQNAMQSAGPVASTAGQATSVVANMLPSILTSIITKKPDAGLALMSATAAGSAAKEAYNKGATAEQAAYTGYEKGYVEYMTENMFDFIGAFGGGMLSPKLKELLGDAAMTKAGRAILKLADFYGENIEESVSDWAGPGIDRAVWGNEDEEDLSILQALAGQAPWTEQGLVTMLSTLIMGGATSVIQNNVVTVPKEQAQEILEIAKNSGNKHLAAMAEQYSKILERKGKLGAGRVQEIQEHTQRVMGEENYTKAILDAEKQRMAAQAKENAQQRRVAKYLDRVRAGEVDQTGTADTKNATVEYQGRQAKIDFVRDGNENRVRLTFEDGSEKTVSFQEAAEAGLDENIKNLITALSAIGPNAPAAYSVYDSSQEVGKYAAAMDEAINLYAAQGQDVRQAAKAAKEAGSTALITYLNDAQLELAQSLGAKTYEQKQAQIREAGAKLKQIRQQAQEAMQSQDKTAAQGLAEVNTTLAEAREHYKTIRTAFDQTVEYLEEMAANGQQDTEAYQNALEQANYLRSDLEGTQKVISALEAERKKLQKQQPIKRKKGTVSFEGASDGKNTFEGVDPAKLNKKQKAVVDMVKSLADVLDIDFVFFQGPAGTGGFYQGGNTIYININSGMGVGDFNNVIAAGSLSHELTHWLQKFAPEEYEALKQFIIKDITEKQGADEFERLVQQQINWEKGRQLSREDAIDEVVANACQTMLRDSNAITDLAQQNRTLAERIHDFIKDLIDRIKAAFEDVDIRNNAAIYDAARAIQGEYEDILKLWDDALRAAAETGSAVRAMNESTQETMPAAAQRVQYMAIEYTTDNKPVAIIEEDILAGVPQDQWVKTVRNEMKNRFSGGIPISGRLIKVNEITRSEYTGSKETMQYKATDGTVYEDKLKAAGGLDDIILASTNYINEDLKHSRKDRFKEFARGDVLMRIGGNDYSAKVIVGFTTGDSMVLYDVVDFTPESFTIKQKRNPHTGTNSSEADIPGRDSVSESIVPEAAAPVKQEISSAATSINASKLPALFTNKNAVFKEGGTNIDIGGGRFDNVTDYLAGKGVSNYVFDPYNRPEDTNLATLRFLLDGNKSDTATCANVLNVIREQAARDNVILEAAKTIKPDGKAYFIVYEGDGSGEGRVTKSGWQENRKTASYESELRKYFDKVTPKGKLLIAENPKANLPKATWETTPGKATLYQQWDTQHNEWAPEFYSKMDRTITDWTNGKGQKLPEKMAASQVVGWLKGKGVKDEEIKWSGIVPYLEGKKTVTQAELQAVMAGNEIRIQTKVLEDTKLPEFIAEIPSVGDYLEFANYNEAYEYARRLATRRGLNPDQIRFEDGKFFVFDSEAFEVQVVLEVQQPNIWDEETGERIGNRTHWKNYTMMGGTNYREIMFQIPGMKYENRSSRLHWRDDAPGTIAHARIQDMEDEHGVPVLFVEEIQSDLHNAGASSGFTSQDQIDQYNKLMREARDKNRKKPSLVNSIYYALGELTFKNPDVFGDSFVTQASIESWIGGYSLSPSDSFDEDYNTPEMQKKQSDLAYSILTDEQKKQIEEIRKASKALKEFTDKNKGVDFFDAAPDVPFAGSADTYHEYIMKHILRMAAEGGYGAVGWTTAQQQSERWSDEYAEGYRIEYDQNIPKFMRKYGKQWGAKVEGINLENGNEVWGMYVDQEMADSVLYEGQPRYQEWSNLTDEEKQAEINTSMTMDQARTMIQKAFVANEIKEWYDGKYKNGDEWIKAEGIDEVAMYIENEYEIARKYLYSNEHINNNDYSVYDILDAYLAGTLTGKAKPKLSRVDTSVSYGYQDNRFYAPSSGSATPELWALANSRATKSNQSAVNQARKNILMAAHNGDITGALGITSAELNKKLRQWSRYSAKAREASMRINANVAPENQWTGIQNCSILNGMNISDEDILSMVAGITGRSSEYGRRYVGNAMLALDTHIDWSWLSFNFSGGYVNPERKSVRGLYEDSKKLITVGAQGAQNTVSHEMGHALDFQWERDLFGENRGKGTALSQNAWVESLIRDDDGRTFYRNYRAFIDELQDVNENYNSYTMEPTEIFARFVAKFVQWTQNIAGAYTFDEYHGYNDRFTTKHYLDFAKLLQEKAALDSKWATEDAKTQNQSWSEDQISLDEWMNGGAKEDTGLHPRIRKLLDDAAATEQRVREFFTQIPEDSEYYLDPDEIDNMMEVDPFGNAYDGYMYDAEQIVANLSDLSKGLHGEAKEQAYELMDELLGYMSTLRASNWKEERLSENKTFTEWYNRKHPSLYYPGYVPGKFNYTEEKQYLRRGIRNGVFTGEELAEAQRMLAAMDDPATGTWYQQWDIDPEDFATETAERKESYTRIQAEDVTLAEAIEGLNAAIAKQKTTIGKIQEKLRLGRTKETRESDAIKLAKHLLAKHSSVADVDRVTAELKALGDYILQSKKVDQDELKQRARVIASEIIENAEQEAEPSGEEQIYRDIAGEIKGKKYSIDTKDLGELDTVGGYESFRRANFGKFTLAKRAKNGEVKAGYETVESAYRALQKTYGMAYFPDMAGKTEGDLIQIMASYFDLAEPVIVNPYQQYLGEAIEETANGIVADALDGILRPVSTEATTKQQAKELGKQIEAGEQGAVNLIAAAQKIAEAYENADSRIEALKLSIDLLKKQGNQANEKELEALRETVYDLTIALDKAESHYRTLQRSAEARMAQIREEGRARQAEIRAEAKAKANAAASKHYKEMAQRARERRIESAGANKYRAKIQKQAKKLTEWLLKNSDKEHVPEALKAPLLEFLTSIDFTSKRALNGGAQTQNDMKFGARLQRLQQMMQNQQSYIDGNGEMQEDLGGYIDISPDMMQYLRDMAQRVTAAMSAGETYTINQMTAAELKDLSNLLASLTTSIRNMNNFMANARYDTVREAASQDIDEMEKLGQAAERESKGIWKFLKWKDATPYYAMKRLGRGAQSVFDGLTRGWEKLAFHAKEIIDFTEKTYTDKEVNEWKKQIRNIELSDGSQIRMTTAQIMELAMLYNRDQAQKHLRAGGMRIGNIEYNKGTITDTKHYHLTAADINKLFDMLTPRQLEVAYKLQKFMANKGAEWGNEISMRRFGYEFYTEGENYYPIRTDSNDRAMRDTDAQENSMFRLLNLSSSKSLNPKASNALVVGDIFDTFADHMADQAKLNALGLPILDGIKWFNYKERIDLEDGTYDTRTLQAAMEQAFGAEAQHYFRTLMKDINGVTESGDRGTTLASKMMSNYKIASVGANLRVAMLQPTAYVRAQTILSPRNLLRAFAYKNGYKEAMKYSGTAVWKSMGYYDTNISRNMRQQIQHNETVRDKIVEASMKLAERGDQVTWGRIWVACKLQAQDMNPDLKGEALIQETANLFRAVVYSSQVMDSTLTRSELMRSHSFWDKNLTAFMAEPTLSYNILLDAYSEYDKDVRERGKQGAWQRNSGKILKAITIYESSAIVAAIAESIADAVRDDDDDESALDKFLQAFLGEDSFLDGNLFQDVVLTGKIPYAKNVWSLLQGFDNSDMVFGGISNLIKVFEIWKETVQLATGELDKATKTTYYGNMTTWGKVYKTLQSLSQVSGFPVSGMMRDVFAIWNSTAGNIVPYWKIKTYDKNHLSQGQKTAWTENLKGLGITEGQYQRMRTEMDADGNGSLKQDEVGAYLDEQVKFGNLTREQADAIWATAGTTWKKTYSQWRGDPEPTPAPTAAAPVQAVTPEKITSYEQFRKAAHIFSDNKEEAYSLWKSEVEPRGIDLDTYVQYINSSDVNDNGSVTQNELGPTLMNAIGRRELTEAQAEAIWHTIWNQPRSKTFAKWSAAHATKDGMPGIDELIELNENPDRYNVGDTTASYDEIDQEYLSKGYEPMRTGDVRALEEWQPYWTLEEYQQLENTVDQMVDAFPGYEESLMFDYVQEMYVGYLDNPDYDGQTFEDYLDGEVPQMIAYERRYRTGNTTKATRREALYDEIRLAAGGARYARSILNRGR